MEINEKKIDTHIVLYVVGSLTLTLNVWEYPYFLYTTQNTSLGIVSIFSGQSTKLFKKEFILQEIYYNIIQYKEKEFFFVIM